MDSPPYAFVTLVTTDAYLPGALVVAAALRDLHPSPPQSLGELDPSEFHIVCLVTPETVNVQTLKLLRKAFDVVIGVEIIKEDTKDALALLGRLDLGTVLTKVHIFRLNAYSKIIFLDADVLPLLPLSHLFHTTSAFAAVPDVGWPDIFNSGVLVITPGEDKFKEIMELIVSQGSWDGGDQGVLNEWRGNDWERLSFTYNTTPTAAYTYAPAYKRFGSEIKIVHFIGPNKPWSDLPFRAPGSSQCGTSEVCTSPGCYSYSTLLDRWFAIYDSHYRSAAPVFSATGEVLPTVFKETIYENAWNRGPILGPAVAGAPMGLEKLRDLALNGCGQIPTRQKGEGAYMTLPLHGKIDLMSRSHSQMRDLYASRSPDVIPVSPSTESCGSTEITTPVNTLSQSLASLEVSEESKDENQWDPWSWTYANLWDLVPGIQRLAALQFGFGHWGYAIQNPKRDVETGKLHSEQESTYRSWEDRVESTSRDGDDEAEDEDTDLN